MRYKRTKFDGHHQIFMLCLTLSKMHDPTLQSSVSTIKSNHIIIDDMLCPSMFDIRKIVMPLLNGLSLKVGTMVTRSNTHETMIDCERSPLPPSLDDRGRKLDQNWCRAILVILVILVLVVERNGAIAGWKHFSL